MFWRKNQLEGNLSVRNIAKQALAIGMASVAGYAISQASTYNLSQDFSPANNPTGVWAYGAKSNLAGAFVPYTIRGTTPLGGIPIEYWQLVGGQEPTIYRNGTLSTATAGSELTITPGTVWMFGGFNSSPFGFGAIRFTVPVGGGGQYAVESAVSRTYDGSTQGDTDYHVVKNGTELFGVFLAPADRGAYSNTLSLVAGDVIDFLVGRGADNNNYASGLKTHIAIRTLAIPPVTLGLVANGSFELGVDPGISSDVSAPNSTSINGWTVEAASVDYIGSRWTAGDGARCLDLSGTDAGTISQTISGLTVGQTYRLSFLMAANPEVGAINARLRASIGGASQEYSFLQSGFTTANLGWTEKTLDFTASEGAHQLSFTSLNPGWAGAALDKVAIVAVTNVPPEPPVAAAYNLGRDFALVNPNGAWSYGYQSAVGAALNLMVSQQVVQSENGLPILLWHSQGAPAVYANTNETTAISGGEAYPPHIAWCYAGGEGSGRNFVTMRFTVPTDGGGVYRIASAVAPRISSGGDDSDFHVAKNGTELFSQFLGATESGGYTNSIALQAGDTIDFLVGRGANGRLFGSGLKIQATISLETNTPLEPPAGLVANGSFELGLDPGISSDVSAPNSTTITGWTVETASVDYIGSRWTAGDGVRCLDLSGTDAATISQTISGLTVGQTYRLSFLMAANPEVGAIDARLRASIGGASQEYSFLQSGFTTANLGWTEKTLDFTASGSSHQLSFASLNPGWAGGALDKIVIQEVIVSPPPAGLVANGSFELGVDPGISSDVSAPNSTTITGWTVEAASVDYIGSRWIAGDGVRCLDLSGTDAGTISQTIAGLTSGQRYRLSFLMAANPEVGAINARLRASISGASQEYSFLQSGFTTGNLGWTEKTLDFTASGSSHQLSFVSLNPGWAGAALDKISIVVNTNPPSPNHTPLAKAIAAPLFTVWPDQTNLMVIAVDGLTAEVSFDGSLSSDEDNDALEFLWAKDDEGIPFASGVLATNGLEVGFHSVALLVNDAESSGADELWIEVITLEDAVDELYGVVIESDIPRKDKRPLLATLDRVWNSFEDGRLAVGVRQLEVFQKKVLAQVSGKDPETARRLIRASQQIIDAVESYLEQNHESPSHDGKGDDRKK